MTAAIQEEWPKAKSYIGWADQGREEKENQEQTG
jgi:hypothetical protein